MSKSKESADPAVLQYLTTQNRPYSVNDISANLQLGKTAVQKALDSLVQKEKVREKIYGKQKVYVIDQSGFPESSSSELTTMEQQIEDKERMVKEIETSLKETQAQLKAVQSTLTTEQAQEQVSKIQKEVEELQAKHTKLSETTVVIEVKERQEIRKKREAYIKEWRVRKRKCADMLEGIMETYPKSKQDLYEDIGLETDEDVNVVIPA